jgi:hypothetical protein
MRHYPPDWLVITDCLKEPCARRRNFEEAEKPHPQQYITPAWAVRIPELAALGLGCTNIGRILDKTRNQVHRQLHQMRKRGIVPPRKKGAAVRPLYDKEFVLCFNKNEPATVDAAAGSGKGYDLVGTDTPIAM